MSSSKYLKYGWQLIHIMPEGRDRLSVIDGFFRRLKVDLILATESEYADSWANLQKRGYKIVKASINVMPIYWGG